MSPTLRTVLLTALSCSFAAAQDVSGNHQMAVADAATDKKPAPLAFGGLAHLELTATPEIVHATLHVPVADAFGAILLSPSPHQTIFQWDLPPVLSHYTVWWLGLAVEGELEVSIRNPLVDDLTRLYGQAVLINPQGFWTSGVVSAAMP